MFVNGFQSRYLVRRNELCGCEVRWEICKRDHRGEAESLLAPIPLT